MTQILAHIRIIGVHHDRYSPLLTIVVQLKRPFRDVKRKVDWVGSELQISRSDRRVRAYALEEIAS